MVVDFSPTVESVNINRKTLRAVIPATVAFSVNRDRAFDGTGARRSQLL
jgi:hypothetical protein